MDAVLIENFTPSRLVRSRSERRQREHDQNLQRRIISFLFQRHVPSLRRVDVDVQNGTVELYGTVNSFYEKQLCLNCCQRVAGVVQILDHIEVV